MNLPNTRRTAFAVLLIAPVVAHAEWKGEIAAGVSATSGNSETKSVNGRFLVDYLATQWKNSFTASALNNGDEDGTTAERYTAGNKLDYNFNPHDYIFGAVDYEKDLFGGFRERTAETLGYGRHILLGPVHRLDAEIGAGARQTEEQDTGVKENEFIGRLGGRYQWTLSETSAFAQSLKVESGQANTFTEAVTELKMSVIGNIFASVSFTVRNNSDVPADTKRTDSFTAFNLSYRFGAK